MNKKKKKVPNFVFKNTDTTFQHEKATNKINSVCWNIRFNPSNKLINR